MVFVNAVKIDHIVLTTTAPQRCLHFYRDILGLTVDEYEGRYSIRLGASKINIHTRAAEFEPAASYPLSGSLDFCINVDGDIHEVKKELLARGAVLERDIVQRYGSQGPMQSIYLRDPDGNLVELGFYGNGENSGDGK